MYATDGISDHPDFVRLWDTRALRSGDDIPGIGREVSGALETYHVTDQPERVLSVLRKGGALQAAYGEKGQHAELGPGLYASGVPDFWISRAREKWAFLTTITEPELGKLLGALELELARHGRWLTEQERAIAERDLDLVRRGVYQPTVLTQFATQPYGIAFWRPAFLEPLGITPGRTPSVIALRVEGMLAELARSNPDPVLLRTLRRAGVAGAFTRASMATNPELVIWNAAAITKWTIEAEAAEAPRALAPAAADRAGAALRCLGFDVGFKLRGGRAFDAPRSAGLLFDADGVYWPACSLLVTTFGRGEETDDVDASTRAYFGKGAITRRGTAQLPPAELEQWTEVGELDTLFYRRTGTRAPGDFKHPFHKPKGLLRVVFALKGKAARAPVILSRRGAAYRIDMPDGCIVDDRGIVLP